jgi:hypothetical protein
MMKRNLVPGDILRADRGLYRHYGIYAGNSRVIHFVPKKSSFGNDARVRETGIGRFAKGKPFYVCMVSGGSGYSPQETLRRAQSCIGSGGYDIFTKNCEHFVVWCKTGRLQSGQTDKVMDALGGIPVIGEGLREMLQDGGSKGMRVVITNVIGGFFFGLAGGV